MRLARSIATWTAAAMALAAMPALADEADPACFDCVHDRIEHRFRIQDHPIFHPEQVLQERCLSIEFVPPSFDVAADGTQSSIFDVTRETLGTCGTEFVYPLLAFLDQNGEPILFPDPDVYGSFQPIDIRPSYTRFLYTHPRNPPAQGEPFRTIPVGVFYYDTAAHDGQFDRQPWGFFTIRVFRPPVVMLHGLWSNAAAFAEMENAFLAANHYEPYQLYRVDYSPTNDSAFLVNVHRPRDGIDAVIQQSADADLAAGRVDLVAHSMGGILSRLFLQSQEYAGEVRRLVTCNTPHAGSQMANLLLDRTFDPLGLLGTVLSQAMSSENNPTAGCYNGAVSDLNVYSHAINNLLNRGTHPSDVGVHALVTVFDPASAVSPAALPGIPGILLSLLKHCSLSLFSAVFNSPDHDLIVAASSQGGGVPGGVSSAYPGIMHAGSTATAAVINRVLNLLDEPPTSSAFTGAGYAPVPESYFTPSYCPLSVLTAPGWRARPAAGRAAVGPTIAITSPAPGTTVPAGGSLAVAVSASAEIATIGLVTSQPPDRVQTTEQPGPQALFDVTLPADALGRQNLVAVGFDTGGAPVAVSDPVVVEATAPAALETIAVYPPAAYLRRCGTAGLVITGHFADGVARDLSSQPALAFSFAAGHATRHGPSGVMLHEALDDSLTVSLGEVASAPVPIRALSVAGDDGAPCSGGSTTTSTTSSTTTSSTTTTSTTTLPGCDGGCDDGDACTADACEAGSCTHAALAGLPGVACRLAELLSAPLCAPGAIDPRYEARVEKRLARTHELVQQVMDPAAASKRRKRRLARAKRVLSRAASSRAGATTPECVESIAGRVEAIRQVLAAAAA